MKKQVTIILAGLFLIGQTARAQDRNIQPCHTYAAMEHYFSLYPQARAQYEAVQKQLDQEFLQKQNSQAKVAAGPVYTVPVVFHILYTCETDDIKDSVVEAALAQVNSDYARLGSDVNTIAAPFQSLYIDSEIRFVLAKKDPSGNCTSGIVHRYDVKTDWKQADLSYYTGITWDPTKYLNVIIVAQIIPQGTVSGGGTIVGYTHKPGTVGTGTALDAIVYDNGYLSNLDARSLSHEIGHWFNLDHTFGGSNNPGVVCADDGVSDTPPTKGVLGGCPSSLSGNTCSGNGQDNVENIMNYSGCPKNFTTGQTNRMRTSITSNAGNRQNLWQPSNLLATGVNNTTPCAPIANFMSTNCVYTLCAGSSLTFRDHSYNAPVSTYQWAGDNGAVFANTATRSTTVSFPTVGQSVVTLTVGNAQGSSVVSRTVTVIDGTPGSVGTFTESFENSGVPTGWTVINKNANSPEWQQNTQTSLDGSACFYIDGSTVNEDEEDYLQMPVIDALNSPNKLFTFAYAYAQYDSQRDDELRIQGSKDCGGTWSNIVVLSASQMQQNSGGITTNPFIPASPVEWKTYTLSTHPAWNAYKNSTSVMVRFNFVGGAGSHGNNIFIDAIGYSSGSGVPTTTTAINELSLKHQFNVFPNPTSGVTTVNFKLNETAIVNVSILDILGKETQKVFDGNLTAGEQQLEVNQLNTLAPGIYFVNLKVNGATMTSKLIVN